MDHPHHNRAFDGVEQDEEVAVTIWSTPDRTPVRRAAHLDRRALVVGSLRAGVHHLDLRRILAAFTTRAADRSPDVTGLKGTDAGTRELAVGKVVVVQHDLEHVDLAATITHAARLRVAVAQAVPFAPAIAHQLRSNK